KHWVLIVIDLVFGLAYVFDSATPPPPETRKLEGFNCIQMAYRIYWTNLENDKRRVKSQKIRSIQMKCAQQVDTVDSGYYVMKYMYVVVTVYNEYKDNLSEGYVQSNAIL
ncbi:hypothetical protein SOVF_207860, partial [Spinacia oleracea]